MRNSKEEEFFEVMDELITKKDSKKKQDENSPEENKKNMPQKRNPDEFVLEIAPRKKLSVCEYMGKALINIREYYEKEGKEFPTKKGITLSYEAWLTIMKHKEEIEEELDKISKSLTPIKHLKK